MGVLSFVGHAVRWLLLAAFLLASAPLAIYCINFWYKVFQ